MTCGRKAVRTVASRPAVVRLFNMLTPTPCCSDQYVWARWLRPKTLDPWFAKFGLQINLESDRSVPPRGVEATTTVAWIYRNLLARADGIPRPIGFSRRCGAAADEGCGGNRKRLAPLRKSRSVHGWASTPAER